MKTYALNHSTYRHVYHIVWWTKYRRRFIKSYVKGYLQILIDKFQKKYPTLEILTWNSDEDHIHLQVIIPPNIPVSEFVQIFKSRTSLHLKRRFKFIAKIYTKSDSIWSVGYFSSTLWLNDETVRRYIEQQGSEDIPTEQSYLDL